jgi:hypothetical protein
VYQNKPSKPSHGGGYQNQPSHPNYQNRPSDPVYQHEPYDPYNDYSPKQPVVIRSNSW